MRAYELIALLLAAILFTLAALGTPPPRPGWPAWLPLGLLAWVSVPLAYVLRSY